MSKLCFKYKDQEIPAEFYIIPEEAFLISELCLGANYCEEYDIIKKIQKNEENFFDFSKNLIDIGAGDGNYSILLDFNHNYCFEPGKKVSCLLYANMYLKNKVENTEVYNVALGEAEGKIKFNGFVCEGTGSPDELRTDLYGEMHEIQAKTLDSFNIQNVGFIKIDVEGFEEKVIRGGLITIISNNYPPILFECWDVGHYNMTQEKHDSLFNLLKMLGYEIFEHWGDYETHLAIHKTHLNK